MLALLPLILSSLVICFVLTPFCRDFFGFLGLVDIPDFHRKAHLRPIPRVGGIAVIVAYLAVFVAVAIGWGRGLIEANDPAIRLMVKLTPALLLIFAIGMYDDLRGLSAWHKLVGEFCAAGYAFLMGIRLATPAGYSGPHFVIDIAGILWLVLCANAFNLIDGLDGLAAGIALIASSSLLLAALIHHSLGAAIVISPLMGALIGFLYYNFAPASVFLGDCGSLLIGFLLGCYGLILNQHANKGFGRFAPFIVLAFPVFEVTLSIVRRYLRHRPIFSADKNHIHHRILSLGLSHRDTTLVLYGVASLVAVIAILQIILQPQLATVLLVAFLVAGCVAFRFLRYPEFGILGRFVFAGGFRRTLRINIHLHEYEISLAAATTIEECWQVLKDTCRDAAFAYVSMRVDGRHFEDDLQPALAGTGHLQIRLSRWAEATFGYDARVPNQAMLIAPLAQRLQEKLARLKRSAEWLETETLSTEPSKLSRAAAGAGS